MADYAANISVKVNGLNQVEKLETAVKDLTANLSKLTKVAVNPFKGQITALKQINSLLKSNAALLDKYANTKVKAAKAGGGSSTGKIDVQTEAKKLQIHQESLEILSRQVNVIREAATGSGKWSEVMQKLVRAQVEMQEGKKANLTLIRTLLRGSQQILKEEKALNGVIDQRQQTRSGEANAVRNLTQEAKELLAFERDIANFLKEQNKARAEQEKKTKARNQKIRSFAKGAGNAVDNAFGNSISGGLKALEGGAIRGAVAGLSILGAQAATAASNFSVLGNSMDFLQGPIGSAVQAIAELTGQWGLAAVAAAAFAPLLPSMAKGAVKGLEGIGKLSRGLMDLTGMTERAKPALDSLSRSFDTLMGKRDGSFLANGLFGLGPNAMNNLKLPDLNQQAQNAANNFDSKLTMTALPKVMQEFNRQLQVAYNKLEASRRISENWVNVLREGAEVIKQMKLENATQDLSRSMRELDQLNDKRVKQAQDEASYYGTTNRNLQEAIRKTRELTNTRATQPALRPAGMTDSDVVAFNESNQFMNAARPFAPGSMPGMTPDLIKKMNDEALRQASITDKVKQSWAVAGQFANKYRREIAEAAETNALNLKSNKLSVTQSRLRLEYFKKQNAELEKQKGLMALIARQVAKGMDVGGPEGLKQGKQKFGENLALGVGFPLLFGGGPGSVIGSGIGSLFGEGFGGQILGGAIGQILDQAVASGCRRSAMHSWGR